MNELNVNIGLAVEQRVNELGISKSELARRLGIAQQNVNKVVFSKESLDTAKLMEISKALDYNFFELYANSIRKTSLIDSVKLQSFINEQGLGNTEFASKLGITCSELANIFNGGDLSLSMVEKMANILGVQPAELINGASSSAEAPSIKDSRMYEELIALRAENKLLREIQGINVKKAAV